ncbi:hypothetical protein [Kitasatospora sp. HPMI-4]|uniref:hypothetical protein n=1 Tax=Kitasatospora sp. HPMI-4 TaxID=3448443 RepID=UPI003F1D6BBB
MIWIDADGPGQQVGDGLVGGQEAVARRAACGGVRADPDEAPAGEVDRFTAAPQREQVEAARFEAATHPESEADAASAAA